MALTELALPNPEMKAAQDTFFISSGYGTSHSVGCQYLTISICCRGQQDSFKLLRFLLSTFYSLNDGQRTTKASTEMEKDPKNSLFKFIQQYSGYNSELI